MTTGDVVPTCPRCGGRAFYAVESATDAVRVLRCCKCRYAIGAPPTVRSALAGCAIRKLLPLLGLLGLLDQDGEDDGDEWMPRPP